MELGVELHQNFKCGTRFVMRGQCPILSIHELHELFSEPIGHYSCSTQRASHIQQLFKLNPYARRNGPLFYTT